jgi:hydroxymethylglutaryl-CoA lyase
VLEVVQSVNAAGINEVTLCDTIGVANPQQVFETFTRVRHAHPSLKIGAHFHDTRGLALANVVAALDAGIRTFDASVGGLGGCPFAPGAAGNVATEDLVYMLSETGVETGIDLERLLDVSDLVGRLVERPVALTSIAHCCNGNEQLLGLQT